MKANGLQPLFVAKRWSHHTASGGYDRLAELVGGQVVGRRYERSLSNRLLRLYWRKTASDKSHLLDYQFEDWLVECRTVFQSRSQPPLVVHVLYGDEQLDLLLRRRRLLPCPLVATFHLPTPAVQARFEQVQKHLLGGLDAAIVVGKCQLKAYQKWLGPERVFFVPHGIDTLRFSPGAGKAGDGKLRLVTVGDHMRDWEVLHRIADECRILNLPVEFDVVVRKICFPYFTGCPNVRLHAAISEEQLLGLYREADALLMPLIDATANNAILESMACGTPVISTVVGGIPDYVDDSAGWLFPLGEVRAILDLIKNLCANRAPVLSKRAGARAKALAFDWQEIRKQVMAVYRAVNPAGVANLENKG